MSGVEIVAGGFASAAIKKFVNAAGSYLNDNYGLHKKTKEMLDNLKSTLPQVQALMEVAEKQHIQNQGLTDWAKLIKDASYEAEDVLDDFATKSICEDLKGKSKVSKAATSLVKGATNSLLLDSDVKKLIAIVEKLQGLCQQSNTFVGLLELDLKNKQRDVENNESVKPPLILTDDHKLFGRKNEIKLILSMIVGYEIDLAQPGSSQNYNNEAGPSNTLDFGSEKHAEGKSIQDQEAGEGLKPRQKNFSHYGRPHIIPIVGICGVGKTALAQKIYNHRLLEGHFDLKKWFYVSQKSDIHEMVKAFIPSFDPYDPSDQKNKFVENLKGKRFLLVLDDVCSKICSNLDDVLPLFNHGAYGSVILVTTRERNVCDILGTVAPIILNPLERNHILGILEYHAFKENSVSIEKRQEFKMVVWNIVGKLHGIPQAAKVVGTMLRSKMDIEFWEQIFRDLKYHNDILYFLEIAYQHIDANLKQCFAFCLTFPASYIIERDRMIQMWIANNFIQLNSHNEHRSEDSGKRWFNELINLSFFLPTPWPQKYVMNRAMRELAVSIFYDQVFIFDDNPNPCVYGCFLPNEKPFLCSHGYAVIDNGPTTIPTTTRYLTVNTKKATIDLGSCSDKLRMLLFHSDFYVSPTIEQKKGWMGPLNRVKTKYFGNQITCDSFINRTGKLRVLELSYPDAGVKMHIDTICQLPHLRFLDISFSGVTELPESICTLCHLQVLDVRGCNFGKLPKKINQLINLRHLYASKVTIFLIHGIGKLTNLQELEEFRITTNEGHTIGELAEMNEIGGHLSIVGLENVVDEIEAGEARLAKKQHVNVLSLRWAEWENKSPIDGMDKANKILNSLQPHSAVKEFEIENYQGTELPSWTILSVPNIRRFYLKSCHHLKNLPALGKLPYLETLVLEDLTLTHIGEELYGPGTSIFPELKVLKFMGMEKWEVWSPPGERELLPCLEELEIRDCKRLKKTPLPSLNLSCLKKLELSRCTGVLQEGSLSDKRLPLLNSLCISYNPRITLAYQNVPNLKLLSLHWTDAKFTGDGPSLLNLESLILDNCCVPWNRGMILRSLTKLEMNGYPNDILEMSHSSLPSLKVLKLNCSPLKHPDKCLIRERHLLQETKEYRAQMCQRTDYIDTEIQSTHSNEELSSWIVKLPHLLELNLDIGGLTEFPSTLATLASLKSLTLTRRNNYLGIQSLPESGMPPNLKELYIMDASDQLQQRCSTRRRNNYLGIQSLPESGMPPNLKELYIMDASDQLQQRCSKEVGEDWHKIAHIPYIRVNNCTLQML